MQICLPLCTWELPSLSALAISQLLLSSQYFAYFIHSSTSAPSQQTHVGVLYE